MRLVAALLLLSATTDCVRPSEWYELRVREPSAASIEIETPHGVAVLLPPGNAPLEATVPRTTPPYGDSVLYEASAIRSESGAITMRCDACMNAPLTHLLPAGGVTKVDLGAPSDTPRLEPFWTPDALRVRMAQRYSLPAGRGTRGPYDAFEYDLVVPRDAGIELRKKREDVRSDGVTWLVAGALMTVGAGVLVGVGVHSMTSNGVEDEAPGIVAFDIGALLGLWGIAADVVAVESLTAPGPYDVKVEEGERGPP